jgi:hypothetical protein
MSNCPRLVQNRFGGESTGEDTGTVFFTGGISRSPSPLRHPVPGEVHGSPLGAELGLHRADPGGAHADCFLAFYQKTAKKYSLWGMRWRRRACTLPCKKLASKGMHKGKQEPIERIP